MKILSATYRPIAQSGPDDVRGHGAVPVDVYLPPAVTVGDRLAIRSMPGNPALYWIVRVNPDGTDTINGAASFEIYNWGSCYTFVVGAVGDWWVESCYVSVVE